MASIKPKRTAPTVGTLAPILPLLLLRYTSATAQNVSNSKLQGWEKKKPVKQETTKRLPVPGVRQRGSDVFDLLPFS